MRRLATYGRLILALAVTLLVLVGARLRELEPLEGRQGHEGALIAVESALVYETNRAQGPYEVTLPVRRLRERRELVPLRAVSTFELAAPPHDAAWMLYVEDLHDGGRLKLNGTVIADLPVTDARTTVRQLRPARFELPRGLLRAGTNVIERDWAIHENILLMPRMAVGEAKSVELIFAPRDMAYRVLPGISLVVAVMLSLIMFGIYAGNRERKAYLWVGLSSLGFCLVDLIFFVNAIPAALFPYWRLSRFIAGSALTLGSYYFLLEISGVDAPRYRRWTLGIATLLCAAFLGYFACTGKTFEPFFSRAILFMSACFAPLPFLALVRSLLRKFQWRKAVLLLVVLAGAWINLMDLPALKSSRSAAQSGYFFQLFALVWLSSVCAFLIADFSRSLAAQRAQAATMARELAAQKEELQRLHALERAARETEAAALERNRIMQDMHDGLGSQLVSSLVMARAGQLTSQQTYELLRSCIDDLRLAIDTSQDTEDSLLLALGNLRFRMQPRLKAAGINLQWETQMRSGPLPLRPQDQLPVLRIVQESLSNALKHASARTISFKATQTDTELSIRIADDGRGFDVAAAKASAAGKGLASLDKRARVLGAQLQIDSSERGTQVWLKVPLLTQQAVPRGAAHGEG